VRILGENFRGVFSMEFLAKVYIVGCITSWVLIADILLHNIFYYIDDHLYEKNSNSFT